MNEQVTIPQSNSFSMLQAMVGIGALCGLLIVLTYEGTLPRIEKLQAEALQEALFRVIPGITETQPFIYQNEAFVQGSEQDDNVIYAGYDTQGILMGVAIEASGQGYADVIRILYGYNPEEQKVIGFYVLESKETPGLGDKIEKDPLFLDNFSALDVALNEAMNAIQNKVISVKRGSKANPWEVDGITGATISSRAIAGIIENSTQEWLSKIYKRRHDFIKSSDER